LIGTVCLSYFDGQLLLRILWMGWMEFCERRGGFLDRTTATARWGRAKAYIPPIASARWMGHPVYCADARERVVGVYAATDAESGKIAAVLLQLFLCGIE
jgi:hypothetical protein